MSGEHFRTWFQRQLRLRNWKQADFVRYSGFSSSTVSQWANGRRVPDPDSCDTIADTFSLPFNEVLRVAGHWSALPPSEDDELRERLKGLIDGIPAPMLAPVVPMLQGLHEEAIKSRMRVVQSRRPASGE